MQNRIEDGSRCCSPDGYLPIHDRSAPPLNLSTWSSLNPAANALKSGIEWFQDVTGIPWWADIMLLGTSLRFATLPLSMRASATVKNAVKGSQEALKQTKYLLGDVSITSIRPCLLSHQQRQKALRSLLAPGSMSKLWILAPLVQVRSSPRCMACQRSKRKTQHK
jgi:membrane protein insertase Oxa1/YidC/SpoIIIJ